MLWKRLTACQRSASIFKYSGEEGIAFKYSGEEGIAFKYSGEEGIAFKYAVTASVTHARERHTREEDTKLTHRKG